ncbi:hypothetical protein BvCmsNSNP043_04944 [Escherichia coli]|nr:hypothetical protein BvCmsNSNP043_04944 [Escherichia coli]
MGEYTITLYLRILPRINRTTVMQLPGCRQMHIRFRTDTATVFNTSVSRQGNRPCLRTNMTGVTNPHPRFRTDKANFSGIHSTKAGHIQRHLWLRRGISGFFLSLPVCNIHIVTSCGHFQVLRPDTRINLHRPGNDIGIIRARGIHPFARNLNLTTFNTESGQTAVFHLRLPRGQRGPVRINKTAPVATDAGRVRNHHLRLFPGNLNKTVQLAGIATVHFIKNDSRLSLRQPRVPGHHATQLSLHIVMGIIQNDTLVTDVELAVCVM